MIDIERVEATKDASYDGSRRWGGYVVVGYTHRGPSVGKYIKNYLKEHYPNSKKKLSVTRYRNARSVYDFEITFQDDAEEAEFIMTFKNLEGSSL